MYRPQEINLFIYTIGLFSTRNVQFRSLSIFPNGYTLKLVLERLTLSVLGCGTPGVDYSVRGCFDQHALVNFTLVKSDGGSKCVDLLSKCSNPFALVNSWIGLHLNCITWSGIEIASAVKNQPVYIYLHNRLIFSQDRLI